MGQAIASRTSLNNAPWEMVKIPAGYLHTPAMHGCRRSVGTCIPLTFIRIMLTLHLQELNIEGVITSGIVVES